MKQFTQILIGAIIALAVVIGGYWLYQNSESEPAPDKDTEEKVEVLKIGFLAPLSGDAAPIGEGLRQGVELAFNEQGFENVELIIEDTGCDGAVAVSAMNKLVSVDNVQAIVGAACSGATLASAPLAEQNEVVLLSPGSTSPAITDAGEYVFRVAPSDALQGSFGADLVTEMGHTKLAILFSNEEYGVGFNEVLANRFTENGGEVVAQESFERGSSDVKTQLTKIKSTEADALYIITNSPDSAAAALRQATELDLGIQIFGSEGLKLPQVVEGAAGGAEGLITTSPSDGTDEFAQKHQDEYGVAPGLFGAQAYDAMNMIALVIERGAITGPEIRSALADLVYNGVTGRIAFDENGDIEGNYEIFRVEDSVFVPVPSEDSAAGDAMESEGEEASSEDGEAMEQDAMEKKGADSSEGDAMEQNEETHSENGEAMEDTSSGSDEGEGAEETP